MISHPSPSQHPNLLDRLARAAVWLPLVAALAACGGGGGGSASATASTPPTGSAATVITVDVTATDAAVSTAFGSSHYAYINRSVARRNRLFVFFGATDAPPQRYTLIGSAAANAGFYSIGLAYPNGPDPVNAATLCGGSADPDCTGKIHAEVFTGIDASPLVSVDAANSVQNRLTKALLYLSQQYPGDGWGQFLGNGDLRWDLIRISGLSQGGGMAGYVAKQKLLDRACFFSSPADWDTAAGQPAPWVLAAGATPAASIYGFDSQLDPIVVYPRMLRTWTALGLDAFGPPVDVDRVATYGSTHEFSTALGTVMAAHTSTAADTNTPLDTANKSAAYPGGMPVYLPVWTAACFN